MTKVKVLRFNKQNLAHLCSVEGESSKRYIDLQIHGDFTEEDPEKLVGRTFEIEIEEIYLTVARGVKEIK